MASIAKYASWWKQQSKPKQRSILFIGGVAGVCVIRYAFWKMYNRLRSYPNGPLGLPGLGCLLSFGVDTFAFLAHTGSVYGALAYFPLISSKNILISDANVMRQLYKTEKLLSRPPIFRRPQSSRHEEYVFSITGSNGEEWKKRRKLAMLSVMSLTNSSFVLSTMSQAINDHIGPILDERHANSDSSPLWAPRELMAYAAFNNVWTAVFGISLSLNDPFVGKYNKCVFDYFTTSSMSFLVDMMTNFSNNRLVNWIKWHIADKYGHAVIRMLADWMNQHGFIVDSENNILSRSDDRTSRQDEHLYVDVLIEAVRNQHMTVGNALADIADAILGAGTDTTSASAEYMLLLLAKHPEIQEMVYQELQTVIKQHNQKTFDFQMLSELHVFRAFVFESLRISSVAPTGLPHVASRDVHIEVDGKHCVIPKGTLLHANMHYMHKYQDWNNNNKALEQVNNDIHLDYWLDENRKFRKNENFVLFGVGQRDCMGQNLAINALYAMLGLMINKYRFVAPNGDPSCMDIKQTMALVAVVDPPVAIKVEKR